MSNILGAFDAAQGSPNLSALQFLGDNLKPGQVVNLASAIPLTISVAANAGLSFTVPFDCTVFDVIVQSSGTIGGGTVKLSSITGDVTNAIVMAVDKTITRAGTIDATYAKFLKDASFVLTTNASGDRGWVKLLVLKN